MGVVEGWIVVREGGEGGGGEKERGEGDSSTQPCLQPTKLSSIAPHLTCNLLLSEELHCCSSSGM